MAKYKAFTKLSTETIAELDFLIEALSLRLETEQDEHEAMVISGMVGVFKSYRNELIGK